MPGSAATVPFGDALWGPLDPAFTLEGDVNGGGSSIVHRTVGGTDWWRTTERDSHDGPTLGFEREVGDCFEVSVDIEVDPNVQGALFLHVSPTQWIKTGIEYDNGALWNGAVVCNPYSDWSLSKRNKSDSTRFTIAYAKNVLEVYHGDDMIRQVKWFGPTKDNDAATTGPGQQKVFVGIMACSPKEGGAKVTFSNFTIKEGVRSH